MTAQRPPVQFQRSSNPMSITSSRTWARVFDDPQEDCLFVNVWPKPQVGEAKKPVLIWIYGGGFNTGGTNSSAYSGQFWADTEDVVFVNFNYRLSIFGFPGAPGLEQNAGLLDQRMAIEWVRDNIAGFGGDPSRITIFGQSAGGASVDYYNFAWTEDPIIAGSIQQSGTAASFGNKIASSAAKSWYTVAEKVGCGDSSSNPEDVLTCMRSANTTIDNLLTDESAGSGLSAILGNFGPTIDVSIGHLKMYWYLPLTPISVQNKVVFDNYTSRGLAGQFIHKPLLIGNNIFEAGLFILIAAGSGLNIPTSTWEFFDLGTFTCPASVSAEYRVDAGLPVWRYIYAPGFPNEALPTSMNMAWHGAELLPMFGSSEAITKQDSTYQERAMGTYMRGAWAAFAHSPEAGLTQYGWNKYSNTTSSLLQLGLGDVNSTEFSVEPTYNISTAYDATCGAFPYQGAANR